MNDSPLVVLVQPKTGVLSEIKTHPSFPMSLVSAVREADNDFAVNLIDQRIEQDWKEKLGGEISKGPVCVGITSITGAQLHHALEISRFVKETGSNVPLVWGGVHVTLLPEISLAERSIDVLVRGEGEETFPDLLRQILAEKELGDVPGISFLKNGKTVHTEQRSFVDLNPLSSMPYHLARDDYLFLRKGKPSMYLETSRGCPFRCFFCYNSSTRNRRWRAMTPEKALASIEEILQAFPSVRHLSVVDDNFFVDLNRVRTICRLMIRDFPSLTYQVQGTNIEAVKRLTREDLSMLRKSGCERLDMGVESGSEKVLKAINKDIRVEDVREAN